MKSADIFFYILVTAMMTVTIAAIVAKCVLHRKVCDIDGVIGLENEDENIICSEGRN